MQVKRKWTLTVGRALFTCSHCGKKKQGETVIAANGPLPKPTERILVVELDANYTDNKKE